LVEYAMLERNNAFNRTPTYHTDSNNKELKNNSQK